MQFFLCTAAFLLKIRYQNAWLLQHTSIQGHHLCLIIKGVLGECYGVIGSRFHGLVESLAAGTPVVSTNCPGGPSEILENGKSGKLVPSGNAEAFADAILDTIDDPPDRDALIERAKDFSIDIATSRYIDVLGVDRS